MSKHTSNSIAELLKMPMELVLAFYNTLADIFKKEQEASEEQQKKAMSNSGAGGMGNIGSNIPNLGGFAGQLNGVKNAMSSISSMHF